MKATEYKEYKYVMIVTAEDERYETGEKDLSWFGDNPWDGVLEDIVLGDSFEELMGDGKYEGLFQQTYDMETGKRISYGFLDPDTPREEIEEWEMKHSLMNKDKDYKYYEVVFRSYKNLTDTYSICIKATRKLTIREAEEFCKEDMKKMGCDYVYEVIEMTEQEAYMFFDMKTECKWPVFGLEE